MAYATLGDIDARYPGELAQAGPRDVNNDFDLAAVDLALSWASATIDHTLRRLGWTTPVAADPVPDWLRFLAVDLALYQATPTAIASQADFADRRARYVAALDLLAAMARGDVRPPPPPDAASASTASASAAAPDRQFTAATLGGF